MKLSHHRGVLFHVVIVSLLTYAVTRLAITFLLPCVAAQSICCRVQPQHFSPVRWEHHVYSASRRSIKSLDNLFVWSYKSGA